MFKNMHHTHKLIRSQPNNSFILHVYINRNNKLPRSNLIVYSNKLLDGMIFNCNLEKIKKENVQTTTVDKDKLHQYIFNEETFKQEIFIPKNKFFATYKYTFPSITLYPEMTIVLGADTQFEPMTLVFTSDHVNKNDYYKCIISENLIGK
jgi:hypothetical protein